MGKRGPQREDLETLRARGSRLVNERENKPSLVVSIPARPPWVPEDQQDAWDQICETLAKSNAIRDIDQIAAGLLLGALAEYVAAAEGVRIHGLTIETPNGCGIQNPEVGIMHKSRDFLLKTLKEFGMTPASMAGIPVSPPKSNKSKAAKHLAKAEEKTA